MLHVLHRHVYGIDFAMQGMRNPMNSWDKNDTTGNLIGPNDLDLAQRLVKSGSDHSKFMRMIHIQAVVDAPMYWWKEFDTYKVATVRNSCSTMHKLMSRPLVLEDFSFEYCEDDPDTHEEIRYLIDIFNQIRADYIAETDPEKRKRIWYRLIQLLPSSYNQRSTIDFNYATARNMYFARRSHKLDEWHQFIDRLIAKCPYARELIMLEG